MKSAITSNFLQLLTVVSKVRLDTIVNTCSQFR